MLGIHAQVSPLHSEHLIIWAVYLPIICVFDIKVKPGLCKGPFLWKRGKFSYKFISLWNSVGALFILLLFLLLENSFYYFWKKITAFEKSRKSFCCYLVSEFLSDELVSLFNTIHDRKLYNIPSVCMYIPFPSFCSSFLPSLPPSHIFCILHCLINCWKLFPWMFVAI